MTKDYLLDRLKGAYFDDGSKYNALKKFLEKTIRDKNDFESEDNLDFEMLCKISDKSVNDCLNLLKDSQPKKVTRTAKKK